MYPEVSQSCRILPHLLRPILVVEVVEGILEGITDCPQCRSLRLITSITSSNNIIQRVQLLNSITEWSSNNKVALRLATIIITIPATTTTTMVGYIRPASPYRQLAMITEAEAMDV